MLYPLSDAKLPAQAHEILMDFRSPLFRSAGKKSDLASTLQANFPHLSFNGIDQANVLIIAGSVDG
jgi:hypothetical protein